jgi:hypothetical protein
VTLVRLEQPLNATLPMLVPPPGIVRDPLGLVIYPVIVMLVPELVNVRLLGIQIAYRVTLAVPIKKLALAA